MRTCLATCAALAVSAVLAPAASAARDRTPPTTPTNVRVVAVTEDSITISWTASKDNSGKIHAYIAGGSLILRCTPSSDNFDSPSQIEYELYLNGHFFQLTPPGTSAIGIYTQPGTQTWTVKAVDRAGNTSGPSNAVTLTVVADQNLC